jgi:hypothetical protein
MDRDQTDQLLSLMGRIATSLESIDRELPTVGVTTEVGVTGMSNLIGQLEYLINLAPIASELEKIVESTNTVESAITSVGETIEWSSDPYDDD